ncbi:MAG: hypothetical protein ACE5FL_05685, partial [Myxococcota bacterium]
ETVRIAVMMRGPGNLWDIRDPLEPLSGVDVFRRRPEQNLETGEHLVVRRHFVYDVVPLREGTLVVPALRVAFYDPATGAFGVSRSEAVSVDVAARAPVQAQPEAREVATAQAPPSGDASAARAATRRYGAVPTAALALSALLGIALWWRSFGRRRNRSRTLARAEAGRGDATDFARWLRDGIARHLPEARTLTAEEIAAHPKLPPRARQAARLLVEVDRSRFDPSTTAPAPDTVRRALAAL